MVSKKNQVGMSLVEVMVSLSIMTIGILGVATTISYQQRETKSVMDNLARADLQKLLTSVLSNGAVCSSQVVGLVFDGSDLVGSPPILPITQITASAALGAPVLAAPGTVASPISNSLIVASITLSKIVSTGTPDSYTATIVIAFDQTKLVHSLKPIEVSISVDTDPLSPPGAKAITGCMTGGSSTKEVPTGFGIVPHWDHNWGANNYTCPTGYHLDTYHYETGSSNNANFPVCVKN